MMLPFAAALFYLASAPVVMGNTDPCCLTYGQVQDLFKETTCITEMYVAHCLEAGSIGTNGEHYIENKTVSWRKEKGKRVICCHWEAIAKVAKEVELVYGGTTYKDVTEFKKLFKKGDIVILLMKFSDEKKQDKILCKLVAIHGIPIK
jgi:hypothetical protein